MSDHKTSSVVSVLFRYVIRLVLVSSVLVTVYWSFFASDRYVSEATVFLQKTDSVNAQSFDLSMLFTSVGGATRSDQVLLREYLLSVDMLRKIDAAIDLRSHYSDSRWDIFSRMWDRDISIEWFHDYYLSRVDVVYDEFSGVLQIGVQAYDANTARAISRMLVLEGERYMNQIGHNLAEAQVGFLTTQLDLAQRRYQQASRKLLDFQNKEGLVSPETTAQSITAIIAKLTERRTEIQTSLASLPKSLNRNHPNIKMLKQSLAAVDRQINEERAKLASPKGKTLNYAVEEFQRLQMEVTFTQELYKSALMALEKGRMDATRMLKQVSILQLPTLPEYPIEPGRIYNSVVTLLSAMLIAGMLMLLGSIIKDHID
ncbi:MAG: chain-length determining protein [Gammaproteobacteria bacterium]|nr:chain-length determining protein [Gammaproteobacteria bacterium]